MSTNRITLIDADTDAMSTPARAQIPTSGMEALLVCAFGLGTGESVAVLVKNEVADTYSAVYLDGEALTLTPTRPQVTLEGGPTYAFTKTATVAEAGVYAYPRGNR